MQYGHAPDMARYFVLYMDTRWIWRDISCSIWTRAGYGAIFRAQIVSGNIARYRHASHLALHTQQAAGREGIEGAGMGPDGTGGVLGEGGVLGGGWGGSWRGRSVGSGLAGVVEAGGLRENLGLVWDSGRWTK